MKIGILAAMKEEMHALKQRERGFSDKGFVLKISGVGKVNAALAAAELINVDRVGAVIMIGTCGSLKPEIPKGRVVMIKEAMYHDVDAGAIGFPPGQIPFHGVCVWKMDKLVDQSLERALAKNQHPAFRRRIVSGDRFIARKQEGAVIRNTFGADVIDMETAAVGHACDMLSIPWGAVRIVSDSADEKAAESFNAFVLKSSKVLSDIMWNFEMPHRERSSPSAAAFSSDGSVNTVRQFPELEPQNDASQGKRGG